MQTPVTYYKNLISFRECFGRAQELEERLKKIDEENQKADRILKYVIEKSEKKPSLKAAKKLMGSNLSLLTAINTKLGMFEEALIQSREATQLLKDWPYSFVSHMEVESEFYSAQEELYLALASLDRGLKVCDIEGLDIRKISLLEDKLNLSKISEIILLVSDSFFSLKSCEFEINI